jgi:low temperature requirement protein LtrA
MCYIEMTENALLPESETVGPFAGKRDIHTLLKRNPIYTSFDTTGYVFMVCYLGKQGEKFIFYLYLNSKKGSYLQFSPVTSFLLSPNILLSTLLSYTVSVCSLLNIRNHVLHPHETGKILVL